LQYVLQRPYSLKHAALRMSQPWQQSHHMRVPLGMLAMLLQMAHVAFGLLIVCGVKMEFPLESVVGSDVGPPPVVTGTGVGVCDTVDCIDVEGAGVGAT